MCVVLSKKKEGWSTSVAAVLTVYTGQGPRSRSRFEEVEFPEFLLETKKRNMKDLDTVCFAQGTSVTPSSSNIKDSWKVCG